MEHTSPLSGIERRVFVACAEALIGDECGDWVADAAAPFLDVLADTDRALLRTLLRSMEFTGPWFAGRWGEFSGLTLEQRERCLARWAHGPPMLRQAAASLRSLAALVYYGSEPGWKHAGYDGPWLGRRSITVLPEPTVREKGAKVPAHRSAAVLRGRELSGNLHAKADVCVVGAGAGGAAAAASLAGEGVDVILVEAGGYPTAADFTQRELEMLPVLYQDAGLRATADKAIGILQGRGVGGSTLHNTGLVYAAPDGLLDLWRESYAFPHDRVAWGELVDDALDTLGARAIPPDRVNAANDALRRGASALGWRHEIARHNRVECSGCGYCMLGCAYNRKLNTSLTMVPSAIVDGARVLTDARAVSIGGAAGARRVACELSDGSGRPTGSRAEIESKVVVLAAGAIDSPALLQRSGLDGDHVGVGLRLHPTALVYAEFDEPIVAWRGVPQSVIVTEFAPFQDGRGNGFLLLASPGTAPGLGAALAPVWGRAHRELMRRYAHLAVGAVLLHDETRGRVRVTRRGRPVARYWPDAEDTRELLRGIRAAAELYFAAGATRVWLPFAGMAPLTHAGALDGALLRARARPHTLQLNSVHPQGTCAFGDAADTSATTPYGELWEERGIFVCDASLFPTSVGVPPQVTIMALATANAAYIAQEHF